jgi:hypothetical protein
MQLATGITITAGTMTFANEWYQTKQVNWRIPIATLLLAAAFDAMAYLDETVSVMLATMVFIGAGVAEFNGKSAFETLAGLFNPSAPKTPAAQLTKTN